MIAASGRSAYLKLAVRTGDADNRVVSHDLSSDHGHRLTLRGVDLARQDAASRLVLRELKFAQTTTRPGAKVPDVVSNLHQRNCHGVQGAVRFHQRIVRRKCLELRMCVRCDLWATWSLAISYLIWGRLKLDASQLGDLGCDLHVETLLCVQALHNV